MSQKRLKKKYQTAEVARDNCQKNGLKGKLEKIEVVVILHDVI